MGDTIAALASPPGRGGISVVRVSGPGAHVACGRVIRGDLPPDRTFRVRALVAASGEVLDRALVLRMDAPRSFTGEDVVEFQLHGSPAIVTWLLEELEHVGVRSAGPGEFTYRAFLSGRLELTQAEAVGLVVNAADRAQVVGAQRTLNGVLARRLKECRQRAHRVLVAWQAHVDFPVQLDRSATLGPSGFEASWGEIEQLAATLQGIEASDVGQRDRGPTFVIAGAPNVGKSSLLNAWVGGERVLVSEQAGTTRDPVEATFAVNGQEVTIWDVAGENQSAAEELERRGIALGRARWASADRVVWLVAAPEPQWPEIPFAGELWVVGGKADQVDVVERRRQEAEATRRGLRFWGWVSPRSGEGVGELLGSLVAAGAGIGTPRPESLAMTARQRETVRRVAARLATLRIEDPLDVSAETLREVVKGLDQVTGVDSEGTTIDQIFRQFCLGK